jgi:hypothetical protein
LDTKICGKCKQEKSINKFGNDKYNKDGLTTYCNECRKIISHKSYQKNKIKIKRYSQYYNDLNKDNHKNYNKLHYQNNKTKYKQRAKEKAEKEKILKLNQIYLIECLINNSILRAKRKNIPYDEDKDELIQELINNFNGRCECCNRILNNTMREDKKRDNYLSIDRLIPEKGYVKGNISIICYHCNQIKTNATWNEIIQVGNWLKNKLNKEI